LGIERPGIKKQGIVEIEVEENVLYCPEQQGPGKLCNCSSRAFIRERRPGIRSESLIAQNEIVVKGASYSCEGGGICP